GSRGQAAPKPQPIGRVVSVTGARVQGVMRGGPVASRRPVRIGATLKIVTPTSSVFGVVASLTVAEPGIAAGDGDRRLFDMDLLGEIPHGEAGDAPSGFQRGVSVYPLLDDDIHAATPDERARI